MLVGMRDSMSVSWGGGGVVGGIVLVETMFFKGIMYDVCKKFSRFLTG